MADLEELVPRTQEAFAGLISKPKLSEKHLRRPPFRFLHDIVMNTLRAADVGAGLFDEAESDSAQVAQKADKIAFLEKAALFAGHCTGRSIDAFRPAKVVAGMEAEGTNVFLQAFATGIRGAMDGRVDAEAAVRRTLAREAPAPGEPGADAKGDAPDQRRSSKGAEDDAGDKADSKGPDPGEDKQAADKLQRSLSGEASASKAPPASRGSNRAGVEPAGPKSGGMDFGAGDDAKGGGFDAEVEGCTGHPDVTRALLEPILGGKPRLTDKLLGKPPFRFLHDVISAVIERSGFGAGLYSPEEMDSGNVKEKAAKVTYLEKILRLVGMQLNTLVDARPSKIVAGHEPESTNVFLQLLGLCASKAPDSSAAVAAIMRDAGGAAPSQAPSAAAPGSSVPHEPAAASASASASAASRGGFVPAGANGGSAAPDAAAAQASDAPAAERRADDKEEVTESKRSMRPVTARRRPPRVKNNVTEVEKAQEIVAAPAVGILGDGVDDDDDDDDEEAKELEEDIAPGKGDMDLGDGQHGKLVQDIIKRQQEDEQKNGAPDKDSEAKDGAKKAGGIRFGRLKKTGSESKGVASEMELEALRVNLQKLCAAVMPLGKCMDFVTEDLAAMDRELAKWRADAGRHQERLQEEERRTREEVEPLRLKLVDLDEQVKEQARRVNAMKAKVRGNDQRILDLLRMTSGGR